MLPRCISHRFENVGEDTLGMLIAVTPGGFENFFLDAATLRDQSEVAIMKLPADDRLAFLPPAAFRAAHEADPSHLRPPSQQSAVLRRPLGRLSSETANGIVRRATLTRQDLGSGAGVIEISPCEVSVR